MMDDVTQAAPSPESNSTQPESCGPKHQRPSWRAVLLALAAVLIAGCTNSDEAGGSDADASDPADVGADAPSENPSRNHVNAVRVDHNGSWVETDCRIFNEDNVWHADVSNAQGEPLIDLPRELISRVRPQPYDPLQLNAGFPPLDENGELVTPGGAINYVDASDPVVTVDISGSLWNGESEYTAAAFAFGVAIGGKLDHPIPREGVSMQLDSTDDHAIFLDTDRCTSYEHIRWDRIPQRFVSQYLSVFDLSSNYRRLSSEPNWTQPPINSAQGVINSQLSPVAPEVPGMARFNMLGGRGSITATAGSGVSGVAGAVRIDEIFLSPESGDHEVEPHRAIDHAIGAVLPKWWITGTPNSTPTDVVPFVWPATRSDGCAGEQTIDCGVGTVRHGEPSIPMGSRLRLGSSACDADWNHPQAVKIVDALCSYGVVVIDSSNHFSLGLESSNKWDPQAGAELGSLHLSDFDMIDLGGEMSDTLWDAAQRWAADHLEAGSTLGQGWYGGTFWGQLLRSPADPDTPRYMADTLDIVNDPDWLTYP